MDRSERRRIVLAGRRATSVAPEQAAMALAPRSRLARRIRGHIRRLEPVAMLTPRWSAPQEFLEDLALDLAVGEPEIGCRTVSFRPLLGRPAAEARNFLLRVFSELTGGEWGARAVPMVCDRWGFHHAAEQLLDAAQERARCPMALLAHGAEHLTVEILEDLTHVWTAYAERTRGESRCTVLLAGSVDTPALSVDGAARIDLTDFGEAEAAASLVLQLAERDPGIGERALGERAEPDAGAVARAVRFSGGVPAIVQALARGEASGGRFPASPTQYLRAMGPLAEDLRGAVEIALLSPASAERLHDLRDGRPRRQEVEVDRGLLMSGLLRPVRQIGGPHVALRSPALAGATE